MHFIVQKLTHLPSPVPTALTSYYLDQLLANFYQFFHRYIEAKFLEKTIRIFLKSVCPWRKGALRALFSIYLSCEVLLSSTTTVIGIAGAGSAFDSQQSKLQSPCASRIFMTTAIGAAKTIIKNKPITPDAPQAHYRPSLGFIRFPPLPASTDKTTPPAPCY